MIKGIGCDIIKIDRINRLADQARFMKKIFTSVEQQYINEKTIQTAAGLWSAKEAISKALGTGFAGFTAMDIEIVHDENGSPCVRLYNGAQKRFEFLGGTQILVSISHEKDFATAYAVIE